VSRRLLVRLGVAGAAMTVAAGCGAQQELRPQPRPDPSPGYDVTADLPAKSGLRVGAEVTLAGAPAGRVTHLEVHGARLIATLRIRSRYAPLDVDTQAVVRRRRAAPGAAYVVLIPAHYGAPLADESPVRHPE
jgi:ABC-type transporter Mla subunit MlaD